MLKERKKSVLVLIFYLNLTDVKLHIQTTYSNWRCHIIGALGKTLCSVSFGLIHVLFRGTCVWGDSEDNELFSNGNCFKMQWKKTMVSRQCLHSFLQQNARGRHLFPAPRALQSHTHKALLYCIAALAIVLHQSWTSHSGDFFFFFLLSKLNRITSLTNVFS